MKPRAVISLGMWEELLVQLIARKCLGTKKKGIGRSAGSIAKIRMIYKISSVIPVCMH